MFRKVKTPRQTKVERRVMREVGRPIWLWGWAVATLANFAVALFTKPTVFEELALLVLAGMWVPAALITERAYRKLLNVCVDMQNLNEELLDHIRRQDALLDYRDNVIHLFRVREGMGPDQRPS